MTEQWFRGENRFPVDVVLLLFTGLVADVNRSHSTVADKTRSFVFTRYRSAVDTVHRGETRIVCGIRNLQKKSQIAFRSSNIADAPRFSRTSPPPCSTHRRAPRQARRVRTPE